MSDDNKMPHILNFNDDKNVAEGKESIYKNNKNLDNLIDPNKNKERVDDNKEHQNIFEIDQNQEISSAEEKRGGIINSLNKNKEEMDFKTSSKDLLKSLDGLETGIKKTSTKEMFTKFSSNFSKKINKKKELEEIRKTLEKQKQGEDLKESFNELKESRKKWEDSGIRAINIPEKYNIKRKKPVEGRFITIIFIIILFILLGVVFIISGLLNRDLQEIIEPEKLFKSTIDPIKIDRTISIEIDGEENTWIKNIEKQNKQKVLTKIVPFQRIKTDSGKEIIEQLNKKDLNTIFNLKIPNNLLDSFNEYYAIIQYINFDEELKEPIPQYAIIFSIKHHSNALINILSIEKKIPYILSRLIPGFDDEPLSNKKTRIIENLDIKILSTINKDIYYFFYSGELLLITTHGEEFIKLLQQKIAEANIL